MKIEINVIRNGLIVRISADSTPQDPLGQRPSGEWFARDTTDALGRIAACVKSAYDPVLDQLDQD